MQRAAAGLADAHRRLPRPRLRRAACCCWWARATTAATRCTPGPRLARRGAPVDCVLLAPDRAHPAGLAALRAAGGRVVAAPRGGVRRGGGRHRRHRRVAGRCDRTRPGLVAALGDVPVVAVDTPRGVGRGHRAGRRAARAGGDLTVTFGTHKPVHLVDPGAGACGVVHLVDLGLDLPDPAAEALQADDVAALLPRPAPAAQKYTRGVVGVRAGSDRYRGAGLSAWPAPPAAWWAWSATCRRAGETWAARPARGGRPGHRRPPGGRGRSRPGAGLGGRLRRGRRRSRPAAGRAGRRACRWSWTPTVSPPWPLSTARSASPRCSPRTPASWPGCSASSARRSRPTSSARPGGRPSGTAAWCWPRAGTPWSCTPTAGSG